MSWAEIVKASSPDKNKSHPITVRYNKNENKRTITSPNDTIPRHKEITPHPSDDYIMHNQKQEIKVEISQWTGINPEEFNYQGWINYKKNKELNAYRKTLPKSIQMITKWAMKLIHSKKITDLDFKEIEADFKLEYEKNKDDRTKFHNLCFDHNQMFFLCAHYSPNMIQFLFAQILINELGNTGRGTDKKVALTIEQKYKLTKQSFALIKLLITHNFIDINDTLSDDGDGDIKSVFESIKRLIWSLNSEECSVDIVDDWVDLMMVCVNSKDITQQEAIFTINVAADSAKLSRMGRRASGIYCENLLDDFMSECFLHFPLSQPENLKMYARHDMLQKLLFRGMIPFQFIDQNIKLRPGMLETDDWPWMRDDTIFQSFQNDSTKKYLQTLMDSETVLKNTVENDNTHPMSQMAVLAPLVLLPYVSEARQTMNHLLSECIVSKGYIRHNTLANEISEVISSFLFVNYDYFYSKEVRNNLNVRAVVFLCYMSQFVMDEFFVKQFYKRYCDQELIAYLVKNYLHSLSYIIAHSKYMSDKARAVNVNIEVVRSLFEIGHIPLNGLYFILNSMMNGYGFHGHKSVRQMLRLGKDIYGTEFDIMHFHLIGIKEDSVSNSFGRGRRRKSAETSLPHIIENGLIHLSKAEKWSVVTFILSEFEYNVYDPCLLYFSLKHQNITLFQHLINNFDYLLSKICGAMVKVVTENTDSYTMWSKDDWDGKNICWKYLLSVKKKCLIKFNNETDSELLEKTMNEICDIGKYQKYKSYNEFFDSDSDSVVILG